MKKPLFIATALSLFCVLPSCETPEAIYNSAQSHYTAKNYDTAVPLFKKAAARGNTDAQLMLGKCYDFGYGVRKDPAEAVVWYTKAAQAGNADAQINLASCYYFGAGVPVSMENAVTWYKKAAAQGNAVAYNNLGLHYLNGQGVEQNHAMAAEYFTMSAQMGDADGQYNLGKCYLEGIGVKKANKDLARRWLMGLGVPQNMQQAQFWVRKAAAQGQQNAAMFMQDNNWQ